VRLSLRKVPRLPAWRGVVTWPLLLGAGVYLVSVLAAFAGGPGLPSLLPTCWFSAVTGQPCFLCGGTRASFAWAAGDWARALWLNPLVFTALTLAAGLVLLRLAAGRVLRVEGAPRSAWWLAAIAAVAANWWWVATHLPR
jgi:hypothetical protein